jgi:hypothetical protein
MTTIDPSTHLAQLLHRQIASAAATGKVARGRADKQSSPTTTSRVATLAAERIRSIRADDPQRRSKALRVFLECVMQQAFGAEAVHDPNFAPMLQAVEQQMRDDPQVSAAADALARVLLGETKS